MKTLVCVACLYEVAAIATGKVPTITAVCRRHRAAGVVLLCWLAWHLCCKSEERFIEEFLADRKTRHGDG